MLDYFSKLIFRRSDEDPDIIRNEFFQSNLMRWRIYFWVAIPVSLAHVIFFLVHLQGANPVEANWRREIILMHSLLIVLAIMYGGYAYLISGRRKEANRFDLFLGPLFYFLLLVCGVMITIIDQQVTNAITPFLVVCTLSAILLYVRPLYATTVTLAALILLFILIRNHVQDPDVLLSIRANAIAAAGICIGLETLLWQIGLQRFRQSRLISRQKSELETSYRKLRENAEELEKLNASKNRMFSIIGHDLFGPVAGISSYLEILEEETPGLEGGKPEMMSQIGRLRDSVDNTLRLIENLLSWSKSQQNDSAFRPVPVDIPFILRHAVESQKPLADKKKQVIRVPADLPPVSLPGDPNMLETVFRNLIANAIKFSYPEGIIELGMTVDESRVTVSVRDYGTGIKPEIMDKLFKVGEKITSRGTAYEPGTGLGLILCQEFIELHHGKILVDSTSGAGSTFTVELPVQS